MRPSEMIRWSREILEPSFSFIRNKESINICRQINENERAMEEFELGVVGRDFPNLRWSSAGARARGNPGKNSVLI
jgi:hypothetical protein